ncbi:hypothetical protein K7432_008906 [Basidiobolus ranarum]|uniref:Uncharacterized protein n=1 Tax=Basidiobolus ranarum TaxID=34480 RepID=A0ABR2WRA6_9FUNG
MTKATTLFSILVASQAAYAKINRIVAYADSLTDNGNCYRYSGIPSAPYHEGRFSNGPTWIDYTAKALGVPQTNHGYGGATSNNDYVYSQFGDYVIPGFKQQLEQLPPPSGDQKQNVYVIFIAANDILALGHAGTHIVVRNYTATTIVDNVMEGVRLLDTTHKARNLLVFNQFPLYRFPSIKSQDKAYIKNVISQFNSELFKRVDAMKKAHITHVDVHTWLTGILDDPTAYSFKITNTSCLNSSGACDSPDEYVLWDTIHPTTKLHKLLGEYVATIISKNFDSRT